MKHVLLFDLGDTLIRYYRPAEFLPLLKEGIRRTTVYLQRSQRPLPSEAEIERRVHAENYEARNFRVRPLEQRLGRIFGLQRSAGQTHLMMDVCRVFMEPIFAIASLYPDTLPALTALRDRGFRLGIVSNTSWGCPAVLWREELARHGVLSLCEHVLFCRDVGWRKPARPIFQKACELFGCSPDDCVFVGDNVKWDVDGAQKVGMTPVLIDRSGQTRESVVPKIASLFELDALLRSLWDGTSLLTFLRNTPLPKAILCDLDDTILGDSENADACWQRICARYALRIEGLTPETLLTAIDASRRWFWGDPERHRRGRLHLEQARREIVTGALRWLGIEAPVVANEIADAYTVERAGTVQPVPGAIETLRSLRDQGVRLALITNGSTEVQRGKIERFGLVSLFDCILIEGEFGVGKPDPRVYRHTLDQLNVSPEETWMVGDNVEWDVAAPQRLGIVGIWLDIAGSGLPASSPVRPDRIIRTLSDLLEGTVEWTRAPLRTSSKDKGT